MKQIKISDLKAQLSHFLRLVRKGQEIIILDRRLPVAKLSRIVEESDVEISGPTLSIREALEGMPALPPGEMPTDSLALLAEDRRNR